MVQEACFPQLRQGMLYSLHRRNLHEIPELEIIVEKYNVVDYLSNYYIGTWHLASKTR